MATEPKVPVSVLRDLADDLEENARGCDEAAGEMEKGVMSAHFEGKADAYWTAAKRLREYSRAAEAQA